MGRFVEFHLASTQQMSVQAPDLHTCCKQEPEYGAHTTSSNTLRLHILSAAQRSNQWVLSSVGRACLGIPRH